MQNTVTWRKIAHHVLENQTSEQGVDWEMHMIRIIDLGFCDQLECRILVSRVQLLKHLASGASFGQAASDLKTHLMSVAGSGNWCLKGCLCGLCIIMTFKNC